MVLLFLLSQKWQVNRPHKYQTVVVYLDVSNYLTGYSMASNPQNTNLRNHAPLRLHSHNAALSGEQRKPPNLNHCTLNT
ncbi:hypothetical protein DYF89_24235 [Vibrio parahaemolyticus]|nr:hypothetical protein [Vibrio parahaemolyticus]